MGHNGIVKLYLGIHFKDKAVYCSVFDRKVILYEWETSKHASIYHQCHVIIAPSLNQVESTKLGRKYPQLKEHHE